MAVLRRGEPYLDGDVARARGREGTSRKADALPLLVDGRGRLELASADSLLGVVVGGYGATREQREQMHHRQFGRKLYVRAEAESTAGVSCGW